MAIYILVLKLAQKRAGKGTQNREAQAQYPAAKFGGSDRELRAVNMQTAPLHSPKVKQSVPYSTVRLSVFGVLHDFLIFSSLFSKKHLTFQRHGAIMY